MRAHTSTLVVIPTAAIALALLVGCGPTDSQPPATATPTPTIIIEPTPTPTPSATADDAVAVTVGCDELVTAQELYDYNPNFALQAQFSPTPGSLAAEAVAAKGVACSWVNLTSGETIVMAVAHLGDAALTARANELVVSSNSVPTYEVEGYFLLDGGVGTAQAFKSPYWISATSTYFFEPGDVAPLMANALSALG